MDSFNQIFFGPNIFLTKTTSMNTTTTTIKMGFDTIEINLVHTYSYTVVQRHTKLSVCESVSL